MIKVMFKVLTGLLLWGCIWSCSEKSPVKEMRFDHREKLDVLTWKCHVNFEITKDSNAEDSGLTITTYEWQYPGFSWDWVNGDWSGYSRLCFEGRSGNSEREVFYLTVWDGKEPYEYHNRFQKEFVLTNVLHKYCLEFDKGLLDRNNRFLEMKHIKKAVFFGSHPGRPHVFVIKTVTLKG